MPSVVDKKETWRVEFRPMETQPTDFENASFVIFMKLLQQTVLQFGLEMCIPMHLIEDNMRRAQKCNAVSSQKFWFLAKLPCAGDCQHDAELATLDEIFSGRSGPPTGFQGLIPLVRQYLAAVGNSNGLATLEKHLKFVQRKAQGDISTTAQWMRNFVLSHPEYSSESVLTDRVYYDLLRGVEETTRVERDLQWANALIWDMSDSH